MNLENLGVQEMDAQEVKQVEGGFCISTALAIAGACIYVYNNWDDFSEGFSEGYNA